MKPARNRRKWLVVSAILVAAFVLLVVSAGVLSPRLLCVESNVSHGDILVVLGGSSGERPRRAAELYKQGVAPRIFLTGRGDCDFNKSILIGAGVPESAIESECKSKSTKENAQFTIPILKSEGVKRAIIVTSWFHSRRALACFQKYGPGIEYESAVVYRTEPSLWPDKYERPYVFMEYFKIAGYWMCYGVRPF